MDKQLVKIFIIASVIAFAGCDKKPASEESASKTEETAAVTQEKAPETGDMSMSSAPMHEKPSMHEESISTMEATVTAIDQTTRQVTLKKADGESVSFIADEEVKNLAQVEVGDKLLLEYLEAVTVQVLDSDHAELGTTVVEESARAKPGEKPGAVAVSEVTVVVVIEAIDKEHEKVTLKGAEGKSKTVKVRNPDNLSKVTVGDKVAITYTEAIAVNVTKK